MWRLISPDGTVFEAETAIQCLHKEISSRVPAEVQLERIFKFVDEEPPQPFSIEKWETGEYDVVTREGNPVNILRVNLGNKYPILADAGADDTISGRLFTAEGKYSNRRETKIDLLLVRKCDF